MPDSCSRTGRKRRVVAINFCGGCSPMIDRRDIAHEIKDALLERGFDVAFNDRTAHATVQLSGCARNCVASQQSTDRPAVVIAGSSIDAFGVDEDEIAHRAVTVLMARLDGRADPTADHHADDAPSRRGRASSIACKDHEEPR